MSDSEPTDGGGPAGGEGGAGGARGEDAPDEYDVAPGAPAPRCPYCDAPFRTTDLRDLHVGVEHPAAMDEDERAAHEAAREADAEALRLFRFKALAALVLLYFGFLFAYSIFA